MLKKRQIIERANDQMFTFPPILGNILPKLRYIPYAPICSALFKLEFLILMVKKIPSPKQNLLFV